MRKLDRYIVRTVGGATLLVMFVVLSLDLIFAFIHELDNIEGGYQIPQALSYILLTIPRRIYDYLPLGAFMGALTGLGALASSSELVVIRAAGVSIPRIVWSAMKPTVLVVVAGLLIGEYVAPPIEAMADSQRAIARGSSAQVVSSEGLWHREGNTVAHINAVQAGGTLYGVLLFDFNDDRWLTSTTYAEQAKYRNGDWMLKNAVTTNLSVEGTSRQSSDQKRWPTDLTPNVLRTLGSWSRAASQSVICTRKPPIP